MRGLISNELPNYTPTSTQNILQQAAKLPRAGQASFESALAGYVEAVQDLATHFCSRDRTGTGIDRVFMTFPSWSLPNMCWKLRVDGCPFIF
jgi:hypothetical protein